MLLKGSLTAEMREYAEAMISGEIPVNKARVQMAERFLRDLDNPDYIINEASYIFCTMLIEGTFKHIKGPARGEFFKLEMWQKFIVFNLTAFELKESPGERRFKEAFIYIPRKNSKTFFASALAWALAMLEKDNYAVLYIVATKLDRAREAFDNILENINFMGERENFKIRDNNAEHSISRTWEENGKESGQLKIQALASDSKKADGLNANIIILDEIHGYKSANDYFVYRQAMKAYRNKLLIGITTAGASQNSFCYSRLKYCRDVVSGVVKDEQYFVFICEADSPEEYTDAYQHKIANPNYGITINPAEIMQEAEQAVYNPETRSEFLNKSLNIYVNTLNAYFNIEEFKSSDEKYNWSIEELAKLPITWYGGADLAKMHDLTAVALYGEYKGVDIVISHAFIPRVEALNKAHESNIPVFGWEEDGWLTIQNTVTTHYEDVARWFEEMRDMGFRIKRVGYDPKFGAEFIHQMKIRRFKIEPTPQLHIYKSQGFRRIERKEKEGELYYMHNNAYLYCVENVKGIEDSDDMIKYGKIEPKSKIDMFDASVMACYEMLQDKKKKEQLEEYLNT